MAQHVLQAGLRIGAQVVAGAVHHAQHHKLGLVRVTLGQAHLVLWVPDQREGGARLQGAHGGCGIKALALGLQALQLDQGAALGLSRGFEGVGAGLVGVGQAHGLLVREVFEVDRIRDTESLIERSVSWQNLFHQFHNSH